MTLKQVFLWLVFGGIAMLLYGYYLQHIVGLEPCPMCVVQRYFFIFVIVFSAVGAWSTRSKLVTSMGVAVILAAIAGGATAARQSWLQLYPPESFSCGRDPFSLINRLPLADVIPKIFAGQGDCSKIDWTFLNLSIANWSLVVFASIVVVMSWALWRKR